MMKVFFFKQIVFLKNSKLFNIDLFYVGSLFTAFSILGRNMFD